MALPKYSTEEERKLARQLAQDKWYCNNKKQANESVKKYAQANSDKIKNKLLLKKYGITLNQYNEMFAAQKGLCAICHQPETSIEYRTGNIRCLAVDHNHVTGKVRELLCYACNITIGLMDESPDRLRAAALYVEKHNA